MEEIGGLKMTMTRKENKLVELETSAVLSGIELHHKEIVTKFILLTYDLPHNEVGDKARREFLLQARALGACQHTESVYLLPYSAAAGEACLELAKAGKLFVWTSESTNPAQAQTVTRNYDEELKEMLMKLSKRVDRMLELQKDRKFGILEKMREKTNDMMNSMGEAVRRRESLDLLILFQAILTRYQYA
jgi:hypothetical protein